MEKYFPPLTPGKGTKRKSSNAKNEVVTPRTTHTSNTTCQSSNAKSEDALDIRRVLDYGEVMVIRQDSVVDDDDDGNIDMDDAQIDHLTQAYFTPDDRQDDDFQEDGLTLTQNMADYGSDKSEPSPKRTKEGFHTDTDDQVSIDVLGIQRVFKKGESFTCKDWAGRLCRQNKNVPSYIQGAVFTILNFYKGGLAKTAECAVRIPLWDAFVHEKERLRIQQNYPNAEFIKLKYSERVDLRKLDRLVVAKPLSDEPLVWSVIRGDMYKIVFDCRPGPFGCIRVPYGFPLLDEMNVDKPAVLELFAGAGGMSTGMMDAFDVRWMVENDPYAVATLQLNHQKGEARVFAEDVEIFLDKAKAGRHGYPKKGQVHHIHASPPCQGFSRANRNGGKNDCENNAKTFLWIDAIRHYEPETASFENVTGMLDAEGMLENKIVHYWEKLLSTLILDTPYHFGAGVLKASDYGDPQNRKRLFIVAAKRGRKLPEFPKPTHGREGLPPCVTVGDVLKDLAVVEPDIGNGQVELPDGRFTDDHCRAGIPPLCRPGPDREKLCAHKPARTVRRTNCIEHFSHERGITIREMARLQSFPDSYQFCGNPNQKRSQIGNAVPIHLARAVAGCINAVYH